MSQLSDDLLYHTNIVSLVEKYVSLRKVGRNRTGLCPFHKEKSPSFTVAEDKQIYKCFWCGKGWNAISFLMEIERIDYRDAAKILAHDANIDLSKYDRKRGEQDISAHEEKREDLKTLNKEAEQRFSQQLIGSIWEEYLREQRKLSQKTIEIFGLWFAPDNHSFVQAMKEKWYQGEQLIQAWLVRAQANNEYSSFFRKRIMFPIWDHIGNVVGFAGRALSADDMPKYLNISETPLYDKSKLLYGMHIAKTHLKEYWSLIIVEWYMDVIALYDAGLAIWVATCGTALTPQHAKLLKRHSDRITFSFDTDSAGFEATIRGLKIAYEHELYPSILTLPPGFKDIDEYVHSDQDYKNYLLDPNSRQDGFLFVIKKLTEQYNIKNPVERKKVQNICFDLLITLQDYSIMMMYIEQLAHVLSTSQESLFQQFKVYLKQKPRFSPAGSNQENPWDPKETWKVISNNWEVLQLFSAFYDDHFLTEFLGDNGSSRGAIEKIKIIIEAIGTMHNEHWSWGTDQQLRREHHYWILDQNKRNSEITSRIQKKLLPQLERILIKSNIENKQSLLQSIWEIKR